MVKRAREMSALAVRALTSEGSYAVGGVAGLNLRVQQGGSRSWVMRYVVDGKRFHMGLGSYPSLSLADAREKARLVRQQCLDGIHPMAHKKALASQRAAEKVTLKTFKEVAEAYMSAHGQSWRNPKHRAQWSSTLERYVYPVMGSLLVRDVEQSHVMAALEPIWTTKNETASRVRGRIETILDFAKVRGLRQRDNPAVWKGQLDKLLPQPSRVKSAGHQKALPFQEMPAFMTKLKNVDGVSARALEFLALSAARSGEVRGARWPEFDLPNRVWTVPSSRMKSGTEHRVPLSARLIELLGAIPRVHGCDYVFPGRKLQPLSDMSLSAVMRRMNVDAVPHGLRSTFRDWAGEVTDFPREVAEAALAHTLQNKTEAAYRRGDALEKRRVMMEQWAAYCCPPSLATSAVQEGHHIESPSKPSMADLFRQASESGRQRAMALAKERSSDVQLQDNVSQTIEPTINKVPSTSKPDAMQDRADRPLMRLNPDLVMRRR